MRKIMWKFNGKILAYSAIITILLFILSSNVLAIGIAVTRAELVYNEVLHGGYSEQTFYVSTDAAIDVPLTYEMEGEIANWTKVIPDINDKNATSYISSSRVQPLTVIIQPPVDVPAGNYTGGIRVLTGSLNTVEGQYGSFLQAAFLVRIKVEVIGDQIVSCSSGGVRVLDAEIDGPLEFVMSIGNSGNVRVRPSATMDIWNQDQSKLLDTKSFSFNAETFPTTSKAYSQRFSHSLPIGQYWGFANIEPCKSSELVTFNIVEKGGIVDTGELIRIDNKPWVKTGEVIPITAIFKNTGKRTVSAKFKGIIVREGELVYTIDSDFQDVAPDEIANLIVFYTPDDLGRYEVTGRVLFNNKLTYEKGSIFTVNQLGEETQGFNWLYVIIICIIFIIIIFLIFKIRERKKRMDWV